MAKAKTKTKTKAKKSKTEKLPKKIFVRRDRIVNEPSSFHLIAEENSADMVEIGEVVLIGVYELVETVRVEGVVKSTPVSMKSR
jgi:hypothetical protein